MLQSVSNQLLALLIGIALFTEGSSSNLACPTSNATCHASPDLTLSAELSLFYLAFYALDFVWSANRDATWIEVRRKIDELVHDKPETDLFVGSAFSLFHSVCLLLLNAAEAAISIGQMVTIDTNKQAVTFVLFGFSATEGTIGFLLEAIRFICICRGRTECYVSAILRRPCRHVKEKRHFKVQSARPYFIRPLFTISG